jgi:hypothetical protein
MEDFGLAPVGTHFVWGDYLRNCIPTSSVLHDDSKLIKRKTSRCLSFEFLSGWLDPVDPGATRSKGDDFAFTVPWLVEPPGLQ